MLYESYENKIRKRYQRFNIIYRFRILLIAISIFAVALLTSFIVTKGMVFNLEFAEEINYGDNVELSLTSFLSKADYLYQEAGSDNWTEEKPLYPGEYIVKVTTKGVFGKREKTLPLVINEKPIDLLIEKEIVEFGDHPFELGINLAFGDYIKEIEYDYKDPSKNKTEVSLANIVINNSSHEDVTRYYNISSNKKEVLFTQRNIEIELLSNSFIYDGNNKTTNEFKITSGSLVSGHYIELTSEADIFNVGRVKNSIEDIKIFDEDGVDVTINYLISKVDQNSYLEITQRDLDIKLKDQEKTYDGTLLTSNELDEIDELQLLSDHQVIVSSNSSILNYGTKLNEISDVTILDKNDNDVTRNYNINKISGELKINKHIIELKSGSNTFEYDGLDFFDYSYEIISGNLFSDEELIEPVNNLVFKNVGSYNNGVEFKVTDKLGNESNNYLVKSSYGVIEITLRELRFETNSATKVYDGDYINDIGYSLNENALAKNHRIEITYLTNQDLYYNVGTYSNVFDFIILDESGYDVTDNYELEIVYGELTILKKDLIIGTNSSLKVYDGNELSDRTINFLDETNISSTDFIEVTDQTSITNVGLADNKVLFNIYHNIFGLNMNDNYNISYEYGSLEITERTITIKNGDYQKVYDGEGLSADQLKYDIKEGSLTSNFKELFFETSGVITNVGTEESFIVEESLIIKSISDEDITNNFTVEFLSGSLEVIARSIIIKPEDIIKEYDGLVLESTLGVTAELTYYELVEDHVINLSTGGSIINYGSVVNTIIEYEIQDSDENIVTDNYDVSKEIGYLSITKRNITIKTSDYSEVYDGKDHNSLDYQIISDNKLVLADYIEIILPTTVNSITKELNYLTASIYSADNESNDINYHISYEYGTIEILKRAITIKSGSISDIYSSEYFFNEELIVTKGSYADNQAALVTNEIHKNSFIDVGVYNNKIDFIIVDSESNDVTFNYDIEFISGEIEILVRELEVKTNSESKEYDGLVLRNNILIFDNLAANDYSYVTSDPNIINVGKIINDINFYLERDNYDVIGNYNITYSYGYLEVMHRKIHLQSATESHLYDSNYFYNDIITIISGSYAYNQNLIFTNYDYLTKYINAGEYQNEFEYLITNQEGIDVTSNYDIIFDVGIITIEKLDLLIKTASILNYIYDGTRLLQSAPIFEEGLIFPVNDNWQIIKETSIVNVNKIINETIISISRDGMVVNNNYNISYEYGSLEVVQREITIKPVDADKIYDGYELVVNDFNYIDSLNEIVFNEYLSYEIIGSITNFGVESSHLLLESLKITKANLEDSTNNYLINIQEGKLEIHKRPVFINPIYKEKVYDGSELTNSLSEVSINSPYHFVLDHYLETTTNGSIVNVGITSNQIKSHDIYDIDENNQNDNYEIHYENGSLEVTPKEIIIKSSSDFKEYDAKYFSNTDFEVLNNGLVEGDVINVIDKTIIINVGSVLNELVYEVTNDKYGEISRNYLISNEFGVLEIKNREITIKTSNENKVYDGFNIFNEDFEIIKGSLADGDKINVILSTIFKDVDVRENRITFDIVNDNLDIFGLNYLITYEYGYLEITPVAIEIITEDYQTTYNGDYITYNNFSYSGEFVLNDQPVIIDKSHYQNIIDVGNHENRFIVNVLDDGFDVTNNYIITYVYGEITVSHLEIEINTFSDSKIYDGSELFNLGFEVISDIPFYDEFFVSNNYSITNKGSISNQLEISVNGSYNRLDVYKNYIITYDFGTLTIEERPIHLKPDFKDKVYDGLPLYAESIREILDQGYYSLVVGDNIYFELLGYQIDIGFGSSNIDRDSLKITNEFGDVTSNYDITTSPGVLEVYKREIHIKPTDESKVYDGNYLTNNNYEFVEAGNYNKLLDGHYIVIVTSGQILNYGNISNEIRETYIYDKNDNVVTDLYEIYTYEGSLEIKQRSITIKSGSNTFEYDGLEHYYYEGINYNINDLVTGDYVTVTGGLKYIFADTYLNKLDYQILDSEGANYNNYLINHEYGTITITKKTIDIIGSDYRQDYDGNYFTYDEYEVLSGKAITDSVSIQKNVQSRFRDAGTYTNELTYILTHQNGLDATNSYQFNIVHGTIVIDRSKLKIEVGYNSKSFDGNNIFGDNLNHHLDDSTNTVRKVNFTIRVSSSSIGIYYDGVISDDYLLYDKNNRVVNNNFIIEITLNAGLEITKESIDFILVPKTKDYDGMPLTSSEIKEPNLKPGFTYEVYADGTITNVGLVENKIYKYYIYDNYGNDITNEYHVITYNSYLKVENETSIVVKAKDKTKVYDGMPLTSNEYEIISGQLLHDEHKIYIETNGTITNVSSNPMINQITNLVIMHGDIDVTMNYDIRYGHPFGNGTLTIEPMVIELKTGSLVEVYNGKFMSAVIPEILSGRLIGNDKLGVDGAVFSAKNVKRDSFGNVVSYKNNNEYLVYTDGLNEPDYMNYNVILSEMGTITINPYEVTFKTGSGIFEYAYDTYYSVSEFEITDLSKINHQLKYTIQEFSQVGVYDNYDANYQILDEKGMDATNNFDIKEEFGTVTIINTNFIIELDEDELFKIYDGNDEFVNVRVVNSDDLIFTLNVFVRSSNVGKDYKIYDYQISVKYEGKDITGNFEFTFKENYRFEIKERLIEIELNNYHAEYDGMIHEATYNIINGSLADKEYLVVESLKVTNVSKQQNYIISIKIFNSNGVDVTSNYNQNIDKTGYVEIEVYHRIFEFELESKRLEYNGLEQSYNDYKVIEGSLAQGDRLVIETNAYLTNVGRKLNEIISYKIINEIGIDVTNNYQEDMNKTEDNTYLEIYRREYQIELIKQIFEYDGTLKTNKIREINGSLAPNHIIEYQTLSSLTNPGKLMDKITSLKIFSLNGDIKEEIDLGNYNYDIDQTVGAYLEVVKRVFHIEVESVSKEYDGILLESDVYNVIDGSIAPNHQFVYEMTGSIIDSGKVLNQIINYQILDENNNDVKQYYDLDFGYDAYLEIHRREITIKPKDLSEEYFGDYLTSNDYFLLDNTELVIEEELFIKTDGKIINVGYIKNNITDAIILNKDNKDVTNNYLITYIEGVLEIVPRELTVKITDQSKNYDGTPLYSNKYEVKKGELVDYTNDKLSIETDGYIVDVGQVTNNVISFEIKGLLGDVTNNYSITWIEGKLTITLELVIQIFTKKMTYDGIEKLFENTDFYFPDQTRRLPEGYHMNLEIGIKDDEVALNVGKYYSEILTLEIYDELGNEVTSKYNVKVNQGTIEINKRRITIQAGSITREYNGEELTYNNYNIITGSLASGHNIVYVGFDYSSRILSAGKVINKIETVDIYDQNGEYQSENYQFNLRDGNLEITKRTIVVKILDKSKVYDGEYLASNDFEIINGTLATTEYNQDILYIHTSGNIVDVGTVVNDVESYQVYGNYGDVTESYNIIFIPGILTITRSLRTNTINNVLYLEERNLNKL